MFGVSKWMPLSRPGSSHWPRRRAESVGALQVHHLLQICRDLQRQLLVWRAVAGAAVNVWRPTVDVRSGAARLATQR